MDGNKSRRTLLGSIAGVLAGGTSLAGTASADDDDDSRLPIKVTGTRVRQFQPDSDQFMVTERFISPDLEKKYGRRVVEFGTEAVPRTVVPETHQNVSEPFEVTGTDTTVIGTFGEHSRAEQKLHESVEGEASATATATYTGPMYVYKSSSSNPNVGDLGERTGPINVGWNENLGMDASDVDSYMHSNGWESPWLGTAGDRWIILRYRTNVTPYTVKQNTHIGKNDGGDFTPDQWHIRAYDLPDHTTDELAVVGQVHHDPIDHGQIGDGADWRFYDSRYEVTDDWVNWGYSTSSEYVDNGDDFDSSSGFIGRIDL